MIDIKEFRVGSHVMVDGKRIKIQCVGYNKGDYEPFLLHKIDGDTYNIKIDDIRPIPITEELLKELGFDVHDLPYRIIGGHNVWCVQQTCYDLEKARVVRLNVWDLTISKSIRIVASEIQYLHQLENFVFLTTGLELIDD